MVLLRAALLDLVMCFHIVGAAVLFRRFFPRESVWLGFFLPALALVTVLNAVEHAVALPRLMVLLPLTTGAILWSFWSARAAWRELRFPSLLFVLAFTYCLVIRGLHPEIPWWTEGLPDLARVVDFCLGERLPPTDSWLPPYAHSGYYTFQHYAASVLVRLFALDVGTGYNVSFALLDALIGLAAAALAQALTGRSWVAAAMMLMVMASFTGSAVLMMMFGRHGFDPLLAYDLHHGWADPHDNPLWRLLAADPYQTRTRLFVPGQGIYMPEFHANLGGHFLTILTLLAGILAARESRSDAPWILLIVFPLMAMITSMWFLPLVAVFALGGGLVAWGLGRRPENPRAVLLIAAAAFALLWPTLSNLAGEAVPLSVHVTTQAEHTWPWLFVEQWWPVYVPWLLLCFAWPRLTALARWLHAAVPMLLVVFEVITIGDREPTLEKIWSGIFTAGLVTFWPLVLQQRAWPFRLAGGLILAASILSLFNWGRESLKGAAVGENFFRLQGDVDFHGDPQKRRLLQVASRSRGTTMLAGEVAWGYYLTPGVATFSDNRCFVGWTYPEELSGRREEAYARARFSEDFYSGRMHDPLPYLSAHQIDSVLIWPDDAIPDAVLEQLKAQLSPAYFYIDCRMGQPNNAGIFLRK